MHEINPGQWNKWYSSVGISEVLRYAGVRGSLDSDDEVFQSAVAAVNEVGQCASRKKIVRECVLTLSGDICEIDSLSVESHSLAAHLQGCGRVLLFAATLGSGVDMLIQRYSAVRMSHAVMLQAAAAALIELYCDNECAQLEQQYAADGLFMLPRFSPGYGDFSLKYQNQLTAHLNAYKYIGIAVSEGGQMTPMKSVTAVIGITHEAPNGGRGSCASGKCMRCPNIHCEFRRVE